MSEIALRPMPDLKPLDPALKPEVREWVNELRMIWRTAGLSMNEFASVHYFDKGSISRYLSGKRVPCHRWFLDQLLAAVADNGKPVTPDVQKHLTQLHLRALEAAHPHEYKVSLVRDELEIAVTSRREAERRARALEEQLSDRNREIQRLTEEKKRLRATWDSEHERLTGEIEQLTRQIQELTSKLDSAKRWAAEGERRCKRLGSVLDLMDQAHSDQRHESDHLNAVDWDSVVLHLPLDDLNAVADFLSVLHRLNLRDQAMALADRVVVHIGDPRHSPFHIKKHDGLLHLVATMRGLRLKNQATELSGLAGWSTSHDRLPAHPQVTRPCS